MGWYTRGAKPSEAVEAKYRSSSGTLTKCNNCYDFTRRERYLIGCSMLYGADLDLTFDAYWATVHGPEPLAAARDALVRHGWLIYMGGFGTGKSTMLKMIVNEARRAGRLAIYTTLANLLDQLKRAFDPKSAVDYVELWDNLLAADVLAIDELDKFNTTEWAMERLQMLAERRYCDWLDKATVVALNNWLAIPGYLRSRLSDRSRCVTINLQGRDLRTVDEEPER